MDAAITDALALTEASTLEQRTVDITTRGARSGRPHRIEIWFHSIDGDVYITGTPGARSWYANLLRNPGFTFHLKHDVQVDLPVTGGRGGFPQARMRSRIGGRCGIGIGRRAAGSRGAVTLSMTASRTSDGHMKCSASPRSRSHTTSYSRSSTS
ncbi:hypothetical protein RS82_00413 [Microbacterium trichothecenolyticum]|uniref:Deazaflavin-dependent oxidoreductase (Nitroreductase family) n=1 Tax=Microbacterium trichothecenolyticum TaxID=69370 RepID=A0A0M2HEK4_MICTR|nr:hypothetical protein RS82_00413 [Microbacterium trichothecenolyticum]